MNENYQLSRRHLLQGMVGASVAGWTLQGVCRDDETLGGNLHFAPFRFDVTPPKGHSCCGGWITPVVAVDDALEAVGFVLLGAGKPIVVCAVDWTGLLNEAHVEWRNALAEAAGTTPDRVAVQCVHQHNAPFACLEAERIVSEQGDLPHIVELDYFRRCLEQGRKAVAEALTKAEPMTHVAHGHAKVDKVASNRRIFRDENGHIKAMRGSSCRDPKLQAMPEGLIDPWMKTVAFYNGERKLASCHYYATHPMSYYGDGHVTSDFAGLARKQRQQDEPDCLHLYFTGCAGNISAGKYNDGSHEARPILTQRVYEGIVASERDLHPEPIQRVGWNTAEILPVARDTLAVESLVQQIGDKSNQVVARNRPSYMLSWLRRLERKIPIVLSSLDVNETSLLHLPAECFIEYQLRAQQIGGERFIATAAYGDGGPWYIPVKEEYPNGGYEVSVAFSDPSIDEALTEGMQALLG
ncbi:MAG: hypothetical protein H6821_12745 [Planctomycetaceae bacterium]|nr:hypothetical protein [Planctomycetales bacterium]MCB9875038.1 hypothetical protein [Planctomycetaceae bacterium]MCB9940097.1 hypothetical protein [Planctomycetaceae bacterium]